MKAIVVKTENEYTQFFLYSDDEIYKHFRKICHNSSMLFLESEEDWEQLTDQYLIPVFMKFQGVGVYDYEGNKYPVLKDDEGVYFIQENYLEFAENVKCVFNFKNLAKKDNGLN